MKEFILNNWLEIVIALMAFIKVITNLTPTTTDNKVFEWMDKIINLIIPNYNKKGGKH
jgi:hypothetical protein|tara:strand:- start:371 stop:544 length:174 start_codon:yes stop_codon:yes gene_type:complete